MDTSTILVFVIGIASMLIAGDLAHDWGRSPKRWVWIAAAIGPLAIPLFYVVVAASAFGKRMNASRA